MRVHVGVWLWVLCVTTSTAQIDRAQASPAGRPSMEILDYTLSGNQDTPELCFQLSQTVMRQPDTPLESFIAADPAAKLAVRPRNNRLCVTGFNFGVTYNVVLKAGLPGVSATLGKDAQFHVQVPDRPPEFSFVSHSADILPRLTGDGLPIRTVNVQSVTIQIYRIADRDMLLAKRAPLTGDMIENAAPPIGEPVWRGTIEPKGDPNRDAVTFLPLERTLGPLKPGLYVAVAWSSGSLGALNNRLLPTQYFTVSDLGLTAYRDAGSLMVSVRSLATAASLQGVDIALVAADNRELARVRTDENGFARFDGGILAGVANERPVAIYAYGAAGEFGALSVDRPESSAALASPARVGVELLPDKALFHAGETVGLIALARSAAGTAPPKLPLTIDIYRPNGALFDRLSLDDRGAGGYAAAFTLPRNDANGRWRVAALAADTATMAGTSAFDVVAPDADPLTLAVNVNAAVLDTSQPGPVAVQAQYEDGQAGANAPGEARVSIGPAINPFPAFPGFSFGLRDEVDAPVTIDPVHFGTDPAGKAGFPLKFGTLPDATRPLDIKIDAQILDAGGRSVAQTITVPIATQDLFFGIKPAGGGNFPEGQTPHFEVVALSRDGARQEKAGAGWEILRRDFAPRWDWDQTRFIYRASVKDTHFAGGHVDIPANSPGTIDVSLPAGRYRIEVFDPKGEAVSSAYFSVGWAPSEAGFTADPITLTPAKPSYNPGDGEDIFVKPPYESDVTLVTAANGIRSATVQHIAAAGANIHIDTPRDARTGVALLASAVAPPIAALPSVPRRAVGYSELAADPAAHQLDVKLDIPEKGIPGQTMSIPVAVTGAGDEPVYIDVIASRGEAAPEKGGEDQGTGSRSIRGVTARPVAFDNYGRIITPSGLSAGGGIDTDVDLPDSTVALATDPQLTPVSSGIVAGDKTGKATVPIVLPDFTGKLSVRAIAWSASKLGQARAELQVHNPLAIELRPPQSIAPEDRAELTMILRNLDGPRGEYHVKPHAEGAVAFLDDSEIVLNLAEHEQRAQSVTLLGRAPGLGRISLEINGPNAIAFENHLSIEVRRAGLPVTRHAAITLKQGGALTLDPALTAGLRPDSLTISMAASAAGAFDLPGLARELHEANYLSAERLVDEATPSLTSPPTPPSPVQSTGGSIGTQIAVDGLLDMQSPDGGFSQWGGVSDPWLSAYVTEFITRAQNAGATVREAPFARALDYLARASSLQPAPLNAPPPSPPAMEGAAYAGKVLAMNKRLDLFQLRYWADRMAPLTRASTTLAFLAAGFAELGDKDAAAALFADAVRMGPAAAADGFASDLRDQALLTALMAETGAVPPAVLQGAFSRMSAAAAARRQFTAQEAAWIFRAQSGIASDDTSISLKLGDQVVQQAGSILIASKPGETPPPIKNLTNAPIHLAATISGIPMASDTKDQAGYEVQRTLFEITGKPVDAMALKQNDLIVVVISGRYSGQGEGRPLIIDPLPAGWEMNAAAIVDPAVRYPWLKDLTGETAVSVANGAYVATPVLAGERHEFKVAYVSRAAIRGQFAMPGAVIEDLVQPALAAHGASGRTKIDAPAP